MVLYPPSDINCLAFAPGTSSSSIDVFSSINGPDLPGTHPLEANLLPGDVLFLPPLVSKCLPLLHLPLFLQDPTRWRANRHIISSNGEWLIDMILVAAHLGANF